MTAAPPARRPAWLSPQPPSARWRPTAGPERPRERAGRVQASVVFIAGEKTEASPPPQPRGDKEQDDAAAKSTLRQGSGMVLSADGYVITSTSLVEKVGKITVTLSDGKQMTAQIIGRDPRTAIALLKASGATGL